MHKLGTTCEIIMFEDSAKVFFCAAREEYLALGAQKFHFSTEIAWQLSRFKFFAELRRFVQNFNVVRIAKVHDIPHRVEGCRLNSVYTNCTLRQKFTHI